MDEDTDPRTPELIVFHLGQAHQQHNPTVAALVATFGATATQWMTPADLTAWEVLDAPVRLRMYRLGRESARTDNGDPGASERGMVTSGAA